MLVRNIGVLVLTLHWSPEEKLWGFRVKRSTTLFLIPYNAGICGSVSS